VRSDLATRWAAVAGSSPGALTLGTDLQRRWSEPHRHYHTLDHLAAVLDRVDELGAYAADLRTVRLAAFFHDAVYDPTRVDNEWRSAQLAEDKLPDLGLSGTASAAVARLVQLTATHDPVAGDADGAVLCDADLAVLAVEPAAYASYASGVRAEYAHVDEPTFRKGRAAVLETLISRPRLFRTQYGTDHWENAARRNVEAELTLLLAAGDANQQP
jgi:predicted metal-dependent HD superfamily phosphohydrolase